jgi:hypothetical protein
MLWASGLAGAAHAVNISITPWTERHRPLIAVFFVVIIYFLSAAAAFDGYYTRYGFRENLPNFSLPSMVDGTANRPFVYRRLLPIIANAVDQSLPAKLKQELVAELIRPSNDLPSQHTRSGLRHGDADNPRYALRYHLIYFLDFLSLFAALFFARAVCIRAGASVFAATCAPCLFALGLPLLLSKGGYLYDLPEVLCLFAALFLAQRRSSWIAWLLIPASILGALNKETFIVFVVALIPFIVGRRSRIRDYLIVAGSLTGSVGTYLVIRRLYASNPGVTVEMHLLNNLAYYSNPLNLVTFDKTYGLLMLSGYSVLTIAVIGLLLSLSWRRQSGAVRRHAVLAAAMNFPLLLLFSAPGEIRNLSMLYPTLAFLIAGSIDRLVPQLRGPEPPDAAVGASAAAGAFGDA